MLLIMRILGVYDKSENLSSIAADSPSASMSFSDDIEYVPESVTTSAM